MDTISEYFNKGFTQSDKFVLAEEAVRKFLKGKFALETTDFYKSVLEQNPKKQSQLGQFHTPKEIVNVVLDCLPSSFEMDLLSGAKILDPSCGTGNFLITIVERLIRHLSFCFLQNLFPKK